MGRYEKNMLEKNYLMISLFMSTKRPQESRSFSHKEEGGDFH